MMACPIRFLRITKFTLEAIYNVFSIQGITDHIDDYVGAQKDYFRHHFCKNFGILEASWSFWRQKHEKKYVQWLLGRASTEEVAELDMYCLDIYRLYNKNQ